jgi:hypothetical protein
VQIEPLADSDSLSICLPHLSILTKQPDEITMSLSDVDVIFADFQRNMKRVDDELNEIIEYSERSKGTISTLASHHREQPFSIAQSRSGQSDLSSITTTFCESIYLHDVPIFKPGKDWNVETEQERIVCVRGSFAKDIAMTLNTSCPLGLVGDDEAAMVDVDFLLEALRMLTQEREMFIRNSLDYVESTRNTASLVAYIELIEL